MDVSILRPVELYNGRAVLGIIPEVQFVTALGHMDDILAMQSVFGLNTVDGFLDAQTIGVVDKAGVDGAALHPCKLASFGPGIGPSAIGQWVADSIISDGRSVICGELIFPVSITVSVGVSMERSAERAGGIGVIRLGQNIPAKVVGIGPGGTIGSCGRVVLIVDAD